MPALAPLLPAAALRAALPHLASAITAFAPATDDGPTVWSLEVPEGAAASLVGPATSAEDLGSWPDIARRTALALVDDVQKAGAVYIVVVVRGGGEAHCALVSIPTEEKKRARAEGLVPLSCAASILTGAYPSG